MGRLTLLGVPKTAAPIGDERHIDADLARSLKDRAPAKEVKPTDIKPRVGAVIGENDANVE